MLKIDAYPFSKSIEVPSSKSFSNRVLILGAIAENDVVINNLSESTDVINMLKCFERIGIKYTRNDSSVTIQSCFPNCEIQTSEPIYLETGDGGTTNRFLIPLLALGKNCYRLNATEKMADRPIEELSSALLKMRVSVAHGNASDDYWLEICGSNRINTALKIDCSRSTQFASGFLLAFGNSDLPITFSNLDSSKKYLEMTQSLVDEFKAGKREFDVPVDFSSLSYPIALGAVTGDVCITNYCGLDPYQADSVFLALLKDIGADVDEDNLLFVKKSKLTAFNFNCSGCPDLTPTLSFIAAFATGTSILSGLEVLKYKESDRISEIIRILDAFGIEYHYHEAQYSLEIVGRPDHKGKFVEFSPPADHRMVMTCYLFMRSLSGGVLHNVEHVNKSFPRFFEIMC